LYESRKDEEEKELGSVINGTRKEKFQQNVLLARKAKCA
jgi:hypothetical protein